MARSSKSEISTDNLISDLIEGTQFQILQKGEGKGSLTDKPKVSTPILALNDFLGGGIPLGAIIEVYGPNSAGKSSIMYETLGNFQKEYSNGVAFIIDTETSTDDSRLRQLGVDPERAPRMGAATLEDGFEQINKILKKMIGNPAYKGFPVMILWDTIAAAPSRAQLAKEDMYGGGMAERARIIKSALMGIFPLIEQQNVLLVLLNQVMADIGGWRPGLTSGGGNALKHDVHLSINVDGGRTNYDGVFAITKDSTVSITKSKISPIINKLPVIIDITRGGVVDRAGSLLWWINTLDQGPFKNQSGWWSISEEYIPKYGVYFNKFPEISEGRYRESKLWDLVRSDENFCDLLQLIWIDKVSNRYILQSEVCKTLRDHLETKLMTNLGITYEELYPVVSESDNSEIDVNELASALGLDTDIDTPPAE